MASPSLKKTGKAGKVEEGNYASSDNPVNSRVHNHGLGLTLLPGSQVPQGGTENSKAAGSDQPEACIKRSRGQRQKVNSLGHTKDGPKAHFITSPGGENLKPPYLQAATGTPYATRSSKRWISSVEYGSLLFDDDSIAEHINVCGSGICYSQNPSSSLAYGIGSQDGLLGVGDVEVEGSDGSRDMHHPIYARKRRKVEVDNTSSRISKSPVSSLPKVLEGVDQDRYFQDYQPKMSGRDATLRKPAPQLGSASSQPHHHKPSSRYQRKTGTENTSAPDSNDTKLAQKTGLRDVCETPKAITPSVTTIKPGLLENPDRTFLPLVNDHTGGRGNATKDGLVLSPSAKHQNRVNSQSTQPIKYRSRSEPLRFLYAKFDIPLLSSLEASIGDDESLARVKPDVPSFLVSPLSTLPSLECYSSAQSLQFLGVKNAHIPEHHFQHKNFVNTHSSSASASSSTASTLHSSTCNSFLSSSLKLRRSASSSLVLPATSLTIDIIALRLRKRSSSVPILRSSFPESSMNNPYTFQQHGLSTPEKSPPKRQICTPDTFSYYQTHGTNVSKINPQRSAFNMATGMPSTLTGDSAAGPYIREERTDIMGPFSHKKEHSMNMMNQAAQGYALQQPGASFTTPSQAQDFLHNAKHNKHNGFAESPNEISSGLQGIASALAQRGPTKDSVYRTLAFVNALPIPGAMQYQMPLDEGYIQARKESEALKVRLLDMQKRYAALEELCRYNDRSYKAHSRTLEAGLANKVNEVQTRYMSLQEKFHRNNQSYTEQLHFLKGESAGKSNEIKKLSDSVDHWKNFAQQLCRLLKNPPAKSLSSETLYNRVVQGNATVRGSVPPSNLHTMATSTATSPQIPYAAEALSTSPTPGVAVATFGVRPARESSAYSSATSAAIDLTVEDTSLEGTTSFFDTSAPMSRESSSQSHGSQALEQFTQNLAQKPLNWINNHPLKAPENPYRANTQQVMQSIIDVDAQPDLFVFNPTDEGLQAAEARKNNASYASYQKTTRVTKNTKEPKLTKAKQRQLEKGHAPAPKAPIKKAKKPRMRGPRETRDEKLARLESERKEEIQKGQDQAEQFRVDALERGAREEAQEKQWAEEMERDIEALMGDGDEDDKEPTAAGDTEPKVAEAAKDSSHSLSEDSAMFDTNGSVEEPTAGASQEQAAVEAEDHSLDHFFEDDGIVSDFNEDSEVAAGEKQPEITQASTVPTDASQNISAPVSTEQPEATGPSKVDWEDFPDLSPIREEYGVYDAGTDYHSFIMGQLEMDVDDPYEYFLNGDATGDTGVAQAGTEAQSNAAAAEESEESEEE